MAINVPAQPLGDALNEWARQTRQTVIVQPALVAGKTAPAVSGNMTPRQALDRLLGGSGLVAATEGGGVVIRQAPPPSPQGEQQLPEVNVQASGQAAPGELPRPYAGGQVARGGALGILGNRDMMDTPFSQMNYTAELIENQQARFIGEVLRNDPSVQLSQLDSVGFLTFAIRGFQPAQGDMLFNGLAIAPTINGTMMTESIERVEVLRGPNALLNGAAPGGSIGGMVNLVPKRAGDAALTQITAEYLSDSQFGAHVDVGRRFGANREFGIRVNGVYRNGDQAIDHSSRESILGAVGLDYRGDGIRLSTDFGYQEQEAQGARRPLGLASSVTVVPGPPSTRTNANQPWELNDTRALYAAVRGEIDMSSNVTAFAGFGATQDRRQSILLNRQITDSLGTLAAGSNFLFAFDDRISTFDIGLRGSFGTGPIQHRVVAAYTHYSSEIRRSPFGVHPMPASNIYTPVFVDAPSSSLLPGFGSVAKISETDLSGGMLGDTLSILDDRVQLTVGVRSQEIKSTNFNQATGAVTADYDKSATTPMVGLVVKPWQGVSLYGNYIEGLQQGPMAPLDAANAGQVFAPFISKGYEAGVKVDFGRVATTLAVFQITQPSAFVNPSTNVFSVDGEQRNRGLELSVFGEVMKGLRLLGGMSYIDAELTRTEGGVNEGNDAAVAPFQLSLYGEWDLPFMPALTLTSRVSYASSQYVDFANAQKIPSWTQWDIGARYRFGRSGSGRAVTIRASIDNVLDTNRWYGSSQSGQLLVRDPRTFRLSASFDF